jgi:outer membrane protein OmpA-like peptidoglycan-associated protein
MSGHTQEPNDSRKFTITAILSFAIVFCFLMLMMNCHGDFQPGGHGAAHNTDHGNTSNHSGTTHEDGAHHDEHESTDSQHETIEVKLPGNISVEAFKGGIEDKLIAFVTKGYDKISDDSLKTIWFDFDNINFKTGSAVLTEESQHQVDNLAAILKAYPGLKLKIGGYTDKTGDEAVNKKISTDRANAVKAALAKAGVGEQVSGAEGYGSEFAKYAADAPESDRVKDRRISVSVRK